MLIRREHTADHASTDTVHRAAFAATTPGGAEPVEVGLVRTLRASRAWLPKLSLVAEDGDGTVVGHVCVTRADLDGQPALALGPLGVLPGPGRSGIQRRSTNSADTAASVRGRQAAAVPAKVRARCSARPGLG